MQGATNSAHVHEIWIWDMRTGTGVLVVHVNTPLCCAVAACCAHGCAVWIFGLLAPLAISVWLFWFWGLGGRLFVVCGFVVCIGFAIGFAQHANTSLHLQ